MTIRAHLRHLIILATLASLSACGGLQGPVMPASDTTSEATPDTPPVTEPVEPAPTSVNPAVIALLDNAQGDASAGRLPSAIASVERALRIEPKNPALWQKLATLKLQKGDFAQAENFAARSNLWAAGNKPMQARNWRIISEARALRGDNAGAKDALTRAQALEQ